MKNTILALLMLVTTGVWAQTGPNYLRAKTLTMGTRESKDEPVTWIINGQDVNILVELYTTKVIINSKKLQTYHVINQVFDEEGTDVVWRCKDSEGLACYIKMGFDKKYPGLIALTIEYDDMIWFYICEKS